MARRSDSPTARRRTAPASRTAPVWPCPCFRGYRGRPECAMTAPMNTTELFSLKGRTALITGGSRGIGKMIAEGFIDQGARVYISSRKADVCDKVAAELSKRGTCISLPMDVSTLDGARALATAYAAKEPK